MKKNVREKNSWHFVFAVLFFVSCGKAGLREANISNTNLEIQAVRMDQQIFSNSIHADTLQHFYDSWTTISPKFQRAYMEDIMRFCPVENPMAYALLYRFSGDELWQDLQHEVDSVFGDLTQEIQALTNAFKRIHVFFPEQYLPKEFVFYNSGFNVMVYPDSAFLGIGLEWFMGSESKFVKMLPSADFPQYKRNKMQRSELLPTAIRGWLLYAFYSKKRFGENLLDATIFYGKVLYVLHCVQPALEIHHILSYTLKQLNWCGENQFNIWKEWVANDLLFSKDYKEIRRFTNDAPFTQGFSQESAPRLGWYMGYVMVKQYMEKNGKVRLVEMMQTDAQKILTDFNPKKH